MPILFSREREVDHPRRVASRLIYLIRHGECVAQTQGAFSGQSDTPLTAKGREQARLVGSLFRGVGITKLVSSDLRRAVQTAEIIGSLLDIRIAFDADCREIDDGRTGQPESSIEPTLPWTGGETMEDLRRRVVRVVDRLQQEAVETVVVTHGLWIRTALGHLAGSLPTLGPVPRNGGAYEVDRAGRFREFDRGESTA